MTDGFTADFVDRWKEPAEVPPQEKPGPLAPAYRGFVFDWIRSAQTYEIWQINRTSIDSPKPEPVALTVP